MADDKPANKGSGGKTPVTESAAGGKPAKPAGGGKPKGGGGKGGGGKGGK